MRYFDDKTKGIIESENRLIIQRIDVLDDVTFKASYIVSSGLYCKGKITALFDLMVMGDLEADELDVKGRFVCMGNCIVSKSITVQNDIWAENIRTSSIICHDQMIAQEIDVDSVTAEGNIIVGKTLAIEEKAQTNQNIICGETAYGAGRIIASTVMTSEPLDLDEGEEAIKSPFLFKTQGGLAADMKIREESLYYAENNDYEGFLSKLLMSSDGSENNCFCRYLKVLKTVEILVCSKVENIKDTAILLGLLEVVDSEYFKLWPKLREWTDLVCQYFANKVCRNQSNKLEFQPATDLKKDYAVLHTKYGKGIVRQIQFLKTSNSISQIATIEFELHGEKKFPIPNSLKYFKIINEKSVLSSDENEDAIECNVSSYEEWLSALVLINRHKEYLGAELHKIMYELLLAKLGLKVKFVQERFKEKGWS